MALRHVLALLLVLLPLAVTTAYTINCNSDSLTHHILERGPEYDHDGMGWRNNSDSLTHHILERAPEYEHDGMDWPNSSVVLPLAATTANTSNLKDGSFTRWDYSSDSLTHHIREWGSSDHYGVGWLNSSEHVPLRFVFLDTSVSHASKCEASEIRRELTFRWRYISYEALKKYRVSCNRHGKSYYNCWRGHLANPYRRGCNFITRCARIFN